MTVYNRKHDYKISSYLTFNDVGRYESTALFLTSLRCIVIVPRVCFMLIYHCTFPELFSIVSFAEFV